MVTISLPANSVQDDAGQGNFASTPLFVNFELPPSNNIDLSLTASVNNANPGQFETIEVTWTVTNSGADAANNVEVQFPFPGSLAYVSEAFTVGSWDLDQRRWFVGDLGAGQSASFTVSLFVLNTDPVDYFGQVTFCQGP